ncbi:acyl-CoA dehydrogenase family protein [Amycolatopsis lurida]
MSTQAEAELLAEVGHVVEELRERVTEAERTHSYPHDLVRKLAKAGVVAAAFPREHGGLGLPYRTYLHALERLAGAWLAVAESVHVQVLAAVGIATHGSAPLREQLLPALLAGDLLAANCMSEPDAGSDLAAVTTSATRDGDEFVLRGTKAWVTHGGIADLYCVYCRTGGAGIGGLSCVVVDAGTPGVRPGKPERKMGVHALPNAQIAFTGAKVPADRVLGRLNRGMLVAATVFEHGRIGLAACAVGLADAVVSHTVAAVKADGSLTGHQSVAFRVADLVTQVSAARALLASAVARKESGLAFGHFAAQAKLFATDTAMRVATDAVDLLGEAGVTDRHPAGRWLREAKLLQIIEGTNQIQRIAIASGL